MTNSFTHYLLCREGSSTPVLMIDESNAHPESFRHPGSSGKILLRGGFPSIIKSSSTPLSTALQLNGDLTDMDHELLTKFAHAESEKINQLSYRSYTVDADNRLCVIADDARALIAFLDTYSGILEIEPLLLKTSHPELPAVTELHISSDQSGYQVDYTVRSPVDSSRCNYCGACGPSCPENCISEQLFFDFDICTFCKVCEKACEPGAVDIYGVEKRVVKSPAILLLGEVSVELPSSRKKIYRESEFSSYLSTLFPYQVDEVVSCNHQICQHSSRTRAGCRLCLDACSYGALTIDDSGIVIDSQKCTECGLCVGRCPTGSMQYLRFDDQSFIEYFRSFPLPKGSSVVLGSSSELHRFWWRHQGSRYNNLFFLEYPNCQALSMMHLAFLLAHGAAQLIILCDSEAGNKDLSATVAEINTLIEKLFQSSHRVHVHDLTHLPPELLHHPYVPLTKKSYTDYSYINRKEKLSSIIRFLTEQSETKVELKLGEIRDFGTILCDENACTQCFACLNECNIQALTADPSAMQLSWTGSLCIACKACVAVCPEHALSEGKSVTLFPDYFTSVELARAEPMRCRECGKVFGTKKSFERVMKILADRQLDHDGHFEYCEDCRVIKLFEDK